MQATPSPSNHGARAPRIEAVYEELRAVAGSYLARERAGHTLQPTALVHEAFVKLMHQPDLTVNDDVHFRALAANAMRQILVDHARARGTVKRGGGWLRVTLADAVAADGTGALDLLALDEALAELEGMSARRARVVELRFFGGLTCDQAARVIDVAPKTAESDWYFARAWLRRRLAQDDAGE